MRLLLVVVLLALGAGVLWLVLGPPTYPAAPEASSPEDAVAVSDDLAALRAPKSPQQIASVPEAPSDPESARMHPPGDSPAAGRREIGGRSGSARLKLSVVGRWDRRPLECDVQLWRLDDPAAAGPLLLHTVRVPESGFEWSEVPQGEYRVHVPDRIRASDDPPAFTVEPPRTEVVLEVETSKLYDLRLEVRDERGTLVRLGRCFSGYRKVAPATPGFTPARAFAQDPGRFDFGSRHLSVETQDGRFDLGQVRDLDCTQGGAPYFELRAKDRSPVSLELPAHEVHFDVGSPRPDGMLVLLGVSLPLGWFDDALLLPDGTLAREAGASVTVRCPAIVIPAEGDDSAWKRVPVHVAVELEGYQPLSFEYRLQEGAPVRRVLVPR